MKAMEVIRIGRRRRRAASTADSNNPKPFRLQLFRKLDDQNGVLAGEADQHDETDLAVNVILQAAQPLRTERAEDRHGDGQQNDERKHEAFVLRGQREIDDEQSEGKEHDGLAAGLDFFEGEPRSIQRCSRGQCFFGEIFHGGDGLAGAVSGRGGAVDFSGAENVVVLDDLAELVVSLTVTRLSSGTIRRCRSGRKTAGGRAAAAVLLVGLHIDAVGTIVEIEIVHVLRAHVDLERRRDLRERHAEALGLFAVDVHHELRIAGAEGGERAR